MFAFYRPGPTSELRAAAATGRTSVRRRGTNRPSLVAAIRMDEGEGGWAGGAGGVGAVKGWHDVSHG